MILYLLTYPDGGAVNGSSVKMAELQQSFGFERSAVPLDDGTYFQPLRHASERWVVQSKSGYAAAPGALFRILYERPSQDFVMVEYGLCDPYEDSEGRVIWQSSSPPRAGRIRPDQALRFIMQHQLQIPESLQELLDAGAAKPACRPLEFWSTGPMLDHSLAMVAQDIDLQDRCEQLTELLFKFVQHLRAWSPTPPIANSHADAIAISLYGTYPVDNKRWWGAKGTVPPASVELEELVWPKELLVLRDQLVAIKSILRVPLGAQQGTWFFGSQWHPSTQEQEIAGQALKATLPDLERLVGDLAWTLDDLSDDVRDAGDETSSAPKASSKARRGDWQALFAYERALQLMGEQASDATERQVYDWMVENALGGEFEKYIPPKFESWQRCRNRARAAQLSGDQPPTESARPRSAVHREEI